MVLNVCFNVHFGFLCFNMFKLVLNVGKIFQFDPKYWIWSYFFSFQVLMWQIQSYVLFSKSTFSIQLGPSANEVNSVSKVDCLFHDQTNKVDYISLVSSSNLMSSKLHIVLKEYFFCPIWPFSKRDQIDPKNKLLVSRLNKQNWSYLSRFKFK